MTPKQQQVLQALRASIEGVISTDQDGTTWGSVYLDNALYKTDDTMTRRAFAEHLSALERAGYYRPVDGDCFGDVRLHDKGQ
jgi:hypothetical protein